MQKYRQQWLGISTKLNGINDENLATFSIRIDFMQSKGYSTHNVIHLCQKSRNEEIMYTPANPSFII